MGGEEGHGQALSPLPWQERLTGAGDKRRTCGRPCAPLSGPALAGPGPRRKRSSPPAFLPPAATPRFAGAVQGPGGWRVGPGPWALDVVWVTRERLARSAGRREGDEVYTPEFPACPQLPGANLPSFSAASGRSLCFGGLPPPRPAQTKGLPVSSSSEVPSCLTFFLLMSFHCPIKWALLEGSVVSHFYVCVISHQVIPSKSRSTSSLVERNFKRGDHALPSGDSMGVHPFPQR